MTTPVTYRVNPRTGEYIGTGYADPDPMRPGSYLVPAFATTDQPPQPGKNEAAVLSDGRWALVPDYRDTEFWIADRSRHIIDALGVEPPADALFEEPPLPAAERRATAKTSIDTAAGAARARYVSAGQLVAEEYRLALEQTEQWRAAGNPADSVPAAISDWAITAGITDEEAAIDIERTAAAWEQVLLAIRQQRLAGKVAVDSAADDADFAVVAQPYIDQLNKMKPV